MTATPQAFDIDIVAGCNLRCPSCPQGNSRGSERPRGIMALSTFKSIIAKIARENPIVSYVGLYSWTEPLLHPELHKFIEVVKSYGYRCMLSSNLNRARNLDQIIKAGPDILHVSLSGFYQDTYGRTHKSGDIENVKANMRELRRVMNLYGSHCHVVVVYHMYKDNMGDDREQMQALCNELGFVFNPVWAYLMPIDKVIDYHEGIVSEADQKVIDLFAVTPVEAKEIALRHNKPDCELRTSRTAINSDGSVSLCCGTFDQKHNIAPSFLDISQKALQRAKYENPLCGPCMEHGIHVSGGHGGIDEWNAIGMKKVRETIQRTAPPPSLQPAATKSGDTRADVKLYLPESEPKKADTTKRPKLSVIIPTYNRSRYLKECLEGVCATTVDCEILIVDNASPDDTQKVAELFAAKDSRIRYIRHETNRGSWFNMTFSMREARGEFLCLLGDDDAVLPGNFEKKLALLDSNPEIGLVYSRWHRIDSESRDLGICNWPGLIDHSYLGGRDDFYDQLPAGYIMHQAVVFRRELYDLYGGLEGWIQGDKGLQYVKVWERPEISEEMTVNGMHTDWDMLLRYCRNTKTAFINEPLVKIRVHETSNSQTLGKAQSMFAESRLVVWRKWLVDNDNPPIVDDVMWQRMHNAFLPDLRWELGDDPARIQHYLNGIQQIRIDHTRRLDHLFMARTGVAAPASATISSVAAVRTAAPIAEVKSDKPAIHWNAPLTDPSGYAEEARNFLFALDGAGFELSAESIRWSNRRAVLPAREESRLLRMMARRPQKGGIHVSHTFPMQFKRQADASLNVGRTMFETDRLPEGWADACNQMDQIWVPSEFNKQTFTNAGVQADKLRIVPGAIDMTPYNLNIQPLAIEGVRGFNFLSVFDWSLRKGWDVLLKAYVEEFTPADDVALVIKTHSSLGYDMTRIGQEIVDFIGSTLGLDMNGIPDIILQDTTLAAHHMPALYRAADCFVLPTRGEGWGRPYMEAMAMGLPTIGTGWSGNTAFMNSDNSYLIDNTVVDVPEAAIREASTFRGHRWAEPDSAHLRSLMRQVFTNREEAKQIGEAARGDIADRFSYERVAGIIAKAIESADSRELAAA